MTTKKPRTLQFRRKKEGKTNYKKRLTLLMSGKNRLVIRKALNNLTLQIIEYSPDGDLVLFSSNSKELIKYGWKAHRGNVPAAYLTGLLLGQKAKDKIKDCIIDIGLYPSKKGARIYAALKGVIDSGIKIKCAEKVFPKEERIFGKHIENYALSMQKENKEKYGKVFSIYLKNNVDPTKITEHFEKSKKSILESRK